jgi:hypothetical protein
MTNSMIKYVESVFQKLGMLKLENSRSPFSRFRLTLVVDFATFGETTMDPQPAQPDEHPDQAHSQGEIRSNRQLMETPLPGQDDNQPQDSGDGRLWSRRRRRETARQTVQLKNGLKAEVGIVLGCLDILHAMQLRNPDEFAALVVLVQPRGAKHLPGREVLTPAALAGLRDSGIIHKDGSVSPAIAMVLDAAFLEPETGGGAVLRDPIVHTDKEQARYLEDFERDSLKRLLRSIESDDPQTWQGRE